MRKWMVVACLLAAASGNAWAQTAKSDAEWKQEDEKAEALYSASNFVGAKPLFEELYTHQPKSLVYEERLAMCLLSTVDDLSDSERIAQQKRARNLLLDAQKNGDDSPLLQTMLERTEGGPPAQAPRVESPGSAQFAEAEKLFSKGELKEAFALYKQALEADPKLYLAAVYAGDSAFKMNDCATAGEYYTKAIAIDPNHETAYRYYGDCLMKMNDMTRARDMFINAVLCQPYQKTTNQALATWAERNHARIVPPPITLARRTAPDAKGNTNITIDMSTIMDPAGPAWLVYLISPTVWQKKDFAEHYPNEAKYRHSLAEEASALHSVVALAKEKKLKPKGNDHTIELLSALDRDGMLECWVLLHDADAGIAKDYGPYMLAHRELMQKYIVKYDIHPM